MHIDLEEAVPAAKPDTAAEAASAIAAASSSNRPSVPNQPGPYFQPPPPGMNMPGSRMRFPPPPLPPMARPNFPPGSRQIGPFIPPGPPGARFRPPQRPATFANSPQVTKSDNKIVSDSMIQAKPQIRLVHTKKFIILDIVCVGMKF